GRAAEAARRSSGGAGVVARRLRPRARSRPIGGAAARLADRRAAGAALGRGHAGAEQAARERGGHHLRPVRRTETLEEPGEIGLDLVCADAQAAGDGLVALTDGQELEGRSFPRCDVKHGRNASFFAISSVSKTVRRAPRRTCSNEKTVQIVTSR